MPLMFPSAEWTEAFKDAINNNAAYRKSAAQWTDGAIALVCKAAPELGLEQAQAMLLDLREGRCLGAQYTADPSALEAAPFVIEASYDRWRAVIRGEVEPIKAMMQGKLKLSRGHLPTIIRDVEGSRQLVLSASHIETEFLG